MSSNTISTVTIHTLTEKVNQLERRLAELTDSQADPDTPNVQCCSCTCHEANNTQNTDRAYDRIPESIGIWHWYPKYRVIKLVKNGC